MLCIYFNTIKKFLKMVKKSLQEKNVSYNNQVVDYYDLEKHLW